VVNLRLLHSTLPFVIIKELKNCIERLLWILHHIGKRSALMVFEELLACDGYAWHFGLWFIDVAAKEDRQFLKLQILKVQMLYLNPSGKAMVRLPIFIPDINIME